MAETASPALQTLLAYYQAWTSHDLDKAMSYIADEIICDAPAGRLEGTAAYRDFMGPFVQVVTGSKMIAAFGDDETALIMYDTETVPVKSAPGAECHGQGRQDHLQPVRLRPGPFRRRPQRLQLTRHGKPAATAGRRALPVLGNDGHSDRRVTPPTGEGPGYVVTAQHSAISGTLDRLPAVS